MAGSRLKQWARARSDGLALEMTAWNSKRRGCVQDARLTFGTMGLCNAFEPIGLGKGTRWHLGSTFALAVEVDSG